MSLLSGYDFVLEIGRETLLKLIKANIAIDGVSLSPPFQIPVPITGGLGGIAWIIVTDLDLALNENNSMVLTFEFERTSIQIESPMNLLFSPLDGQINVTAPIALAAGTGHQMAPAVAMANAQVNVEFSQASMGIIESVLAGTGIPPAVFEAAVEAAATAFFQSLGDQGIPIEFEVRPGENGSLDPLQFERLNLKSIHHSDADHQAIVLLGSFLVVDHALGNPDNKTATSIADDYQLSISISRKAFHNFVFAPAVADALNTSVANLPPTCGNADGVSIGGVTVRRIADSFSNGRIHLNGAVSKSGTCYDASGTFHGTISLSISNSVLLPSIEMDEPSVDVSIPWYCYLVAGVVLGPMGLILAGVIDAAADSIATAMADSVLENAMGNSLPGIGVSGLDGAYLRDVTILNNAINLQGDPPPIHVGSGMTEQFRIAGGVQETHRTEIDSGEFHMIWTFTGVQKDYPYTEYNVQQTGFYHIHQQMFTPPFDLKWELRVFRADATSSDIYPLEGENGNVTLANIQCRYPAPLPGGTAVDKDVVVSFVKTEDGIRLSNQPEDGSYSFNLFVHATDAAGLERTAQDTIAFDGHAVTYGGDYYEDAAADAEAGNEILQRFRDKLLVAYEFIDPLGPVTQVEYLHAIRTIYSMMCMGTDQGDQALVNYKSTLGNAFAHVLRSHSALQVGEVSSRTAMSAQMRLMGLAAANHQTAQQIAGALQALINVRRS